MSTTRIPLFAFDKFKGTLTSEELNELALHEAKNCLGQNYPVNTFALTDGGDGFVDQMTRNWGSKNLMEVPDLLLATRRLGSDTTSGSTGIPKRRFNIGMVPSKQLSNNFRFQYGIGDREFIGVLEMANICGLALIDPVERHPHLTSTANIGHAIRFLTRFDVNRIIIGIGGSSTNDLGFGCLQILGAKFLDDKGDEVSDIRPMSFNRVSRIDLSELAKVPNIMICCDVDNPLLGPDGCTQQFALQKGLSDDQIEETEMELTRMASLLVTATKKSFLTTSDFGMGAAGGFGFGLCMALDAELQNGFHLYSQWTGLPEMIKSSSWIVTGEGRFDKTSLHGKAPTELLRLGAASGKRLAIIAGSIDRDALVTLENELGSRITAFELSSKGVVLSPEKTAERLFKAVRDISSLITHENENSNLPT